MLLNMRDMVSLRVNFESRKYPSEIDKSFHGASESPKMGNLVDYPPDLVTLFFVVVDDTLDNAA